MSCLLSAVCCRLFKLSGPGIRSQQQKLKNVSKNLSCVKSSFTNDHYKTWHKISIYSKNERNVFISQSFKVNPKFKSTIKKQPSYSCVTSDSMPSSHKWNLIRCLQDFRQRRRPAVQRLQLLCEIQLPVPSHPLHSQPGRVHRDHPARWQRAAGPCRDNREQSAHHSAERWHPSRGRKVGAHPQKDIF